MKGQIRERSPGHFAIIIETRDPVTGKRKPEWHSFKGNKRDAQIRCAELVSAVSGGTYLKSTKTTVAEFLERWLTHKQPNCSALTFQRYAEVARKNIAPLLPCAAYTCTWIEA